MGVWNIIIINKYDGEEEEEDGEEEEDEEEEGRQTSDGVDGTSFCTTPPEESL